MQQSFRFIVLAFLVLVFTNTSCGGGGGDTSSGTSPLTPQEQDLVAQNINVGLTVTGSRSFNSNIVHGKIDYYEIRVTGDDFIKELVQRVDGGEDGFELKGIPYGVDRTIIIEAFNPNGQVIRRAKREGVVIAQNTLTNIEMIMHSVPIFTNLTNNGILSGSRFSFEVFGEPNTQLEISLVTQDDTGEELTPMLDVSRNDARLDTSNAAGLFTMNPGPHAKGTYTFQVRDIQRDISTRVTVTLYNATIRPGVGFYAGGRVSGDANGLVMNNMGQPYYREGDGELDLGWMTLIEVIDLML